MPQIPPSLPGAGQHHPGIVRAKPAAIHPSESLTTLFWSPFLKKNPHYEAGGGPRCLASHPAPRLLAGRTKPPPPNPLSWCFLPDPSPSLMWCSWHAPSCSAPSALTETIGRFGAPLVWEDALCPPGAKNMEPQRHPRAPHHGVILADHL